jgi:hypothetical protein
MIRALLLSVVALFMIVSRGVGQTTDPTRSGGLALLAIPEGQPIACHVPEMGSTDPRMPGATIREFRFGRPTAPIASWPREIIVLFDSVGHPLVLSDEVNQLPRGSEGVLAHLSPDGRVEGKSVQTPVDSAALLDAQARGDLNAALAAARPPVSRDLSPGEAAKVRALGAWLWEHRCERERK